MLRLQYCVEDVVDLGKRVRAVAGATKVKLVSGIDTTAVSGSLACFANHLSVLSSVSFHAGFGNARRVEFQSILLRASWLCKGLRIGAANAESNQTSAIMLVAKSNPTHVRAHLMSGILPRE